MNVHSKGWAPPRVDRLMSTAIRPGKCHNPNRHFRFAKDVPLPAWTANAGGLRQVIGVWLEALGRRAADVAGLTQGEANSDGAARMVLRHAGFSYAREAV